MTPKPRILLVEDESGIADTLQYVLATDGFAPVWCSTAAEALRQFASEPPALVVLDVGLPDLNGFELFRRLQALPGGNQVPMLFLTARSDEIDRVVGLELGADDYIAKPFSPRELVARVRTILRRSARPTGAATSTAPTVIAQPSTRPPRRSAHLAAGRGTPPDSFLWPRAGAVALRIRRAAPAGAKTRACVHPRRIAAKGLGRRQRQLRPHGGRPHQDPARQTQAVAPALEPIRTLRGTGYALNEELSGGLKCPNAPASSWASC
jgi:two-component system catabolic regulation response regulator CreB